MSCVFIWYFTQCTDGVYNILGLFGKMTAKYVGGAFPFLW